MAMGMGPSSLPGRRFMTTDELSAEWRPRLLSPLPSPDDLGGYMSSPWAAEAGHADSRFTLSAFERRGRRSASSSHSAGAGAASGVAPDALCSSAAARSRSSLPSWFTARSWSTVRAIRISTDGAPARSARRR
jgi:hypothetical protein